MLGKARLTDRDTLELTVSRSLGLCSRIKNEFKPRATIFIGPLPRFWEKCCRSPEHFAESFEPLAFNEFIRDYNTFISRKFFEKFRGEAVHGVNIDRLLSRDVWSNTIDGKTALIGSDLVHLTPEGVKAMSDGFLQLHHTVDFAPYHDKAIRGMATNFQDWLVSYRLFNVGETGLPTVSYVPSTSNNQSSASSSRVTKKRKMSNLV